MSMNETPSSERKHIAFFGCRNAGKSSLVNAITGQNLSIVSDVLGTTTDPVNKTMEILPLGPVVITDTPGLDDVGELGKMRIEKAVGVLRKTDLAILVVDSSKGFSKADEEPVDRQGEGREDRAAAAGAEEVFSSSIAESRTDEIGGMLRAVGGHEVGPHVVIRAPNINVVDKGV